MKKFACALLGVICAIGVMAGFIAIPLWALGMVSGLKTALIWVAGLGSLVLFDRVVGLDGGDLDEDEEYFTHFCGQQSGAIPEVKHLGDFFSHILLK